MTEGGQALPWWQREFSLSGNIRLKPQAQVSFFQTLASLLEAGFSLPKALRFCADTMRDRAMQRHLEQALEDIQDGRPLAQALSDSGITPRFLIMIETGEAANKLTDIVARIAETLEAEAKRKKELQAALLYPAILITMSFMVMILLVFYLAPTLTPVFATNAAEPPAILQGMIKLRGALITQWSLFLSAGLALVVLAKISAAPLKKVLSPLVLHLPLIGPFIRQSETLNACRTLALMVNSASPLPQALAMASQSASHPSYRQLLTSTEQAVVAGQSLSSTLAQSPLIDPMAAAMIEVAEESDRLGPMLDKLVREMTERSSRTLDQAIKLVTPVLTLVIGLSVGGVILSTISAILTLNDVAF
ncbi:type II secretion system F family protein [Pelagimonas phthalicica]|uniref:type II secretion system F family protein n=1 Tax=Pelagimonas phthalicica TaxID=1037362 RepID=UPI00159BBF3D|nr:type II secretion system F family protein [Pelagimonas phthalicica]